MDSSRKGNGVYWTKFFARCKTQHLFISNLCNVTVKHPNQLTYCCDWWNKEKRPLTHRNAISWLLLFQTLMNRAFHSSTNVNSGGINDLCLAFKHIIHVTWWASSQHLMFQYIHSFWKNVRHLLNNIDISVWSVSLLPNVHFGIK